MTSSPLHSARFSAVPESLTSQQFNEMSAEQMMDEFYPNWWNEHSTETICIPACLDVFKTAYHGASDPEAATFEKEAFETKERYFTGQEAEDAFLRSFQKLKLGGVLVSGFDSKDYPAFKKIKKKKLLAKFGIKDFEIDSIFIHPKIGIFATEIKATKKLNDASNIFDSDGYKKAEKQVKNFTEQISSALMKICSFDQFNIPIYSAICFPFALFDDEKQNSIIHIDQSCFLDEEKLKKLFTSRMNFRPENIEQLEQLKKFACAISGYRSIEFQSAGCNALAIHKIVDLQSFGGGRKIVGNDIFWTNEQLAILECTDRRQIISGPPGTGKTLILLQKALTAAQTPKEGSNIFVLAFEPGLRMKFQAYFDEMAETIIRPPYVVETLENLGPDDDLFCDEFPCVVSIFKDLLERDSHWVIVVTGFINPLQIENVRTLLTESDSMQADLRDFSMNTVIRSSKENFNEWKSEFLNFARSSQIRIGHNCRGPSVKRITAFNGNQILDSIFDIITRLEHQIGPNFQSNLAIITCDGDSDCQLYKEFLTSKGIPCGSAEEQMQHKNIVSVCHFHSILSLEWPFVIVVSLISLDYWQNFVLMAASRCMSQLYIIERDYASLQAVIDEKFCALPNQKRTDQYSIARIVSESWEEFGETSNGVNSLDIIFAQIRLNYVDDEIVQLIEEFKECKTLVQCFSEITRNKALVDWLAMDQQLRVTIESYNGTIFSVSSSPKKLFHCLYSNLSESERANYWKVLVELNQMLIATLEKQANPDATDMARLHGLEKHRQYLAAIISVLLA